MKVVIIGSAGVGKTTLIDELFKQEEIASRFTKIEEQVRVLCAERGYKSVYDIGDDVHKFRFDLLDKQINIENQISALEFTHRTPVLGFRRGICERATGVNSIVNEDGARKSCFISDRSTIDNWVYFMRWSWNSVTVEEAETYYQRAKEQAAKYDLIIYVPIMFDPVDDGFRWANKTYQEQIDRLLRSTVNEWGLGDRVYEIKSLNLNERLAETIATVR
jgi:nicotinamide riboside kinase